MEKKIFAQDDVQALLSNARWLQLDVGDNTPEQREFMQRLGIFGPPTILFYKNQQELKDHRIVGELTKAQFIERAELVKKEM